MCFLDESCILVYRFIKPTINQDIDIFMTKANEIYNIYKHECCMFHSCVTQFADAPIGGAAAHRVTQM